MYNTDMPTRAELPTSAQLIKSTIIAAASAVAILITIVLPSEYGIDYTGIGNALGLTEMGEIKEQLAEEAEVDAQQSSSFSFSLFASVHAAEPAPKDEKTIVLKPRQGIEVKLVMSKGATAQFKWSANGGKLNYDTHGDNRSQSISYEKGRGVPEDTGSITAAFTGNHGWFWRNRTKKNVTLTLQTWGDYEKMVRIK